LYLILKSLDPDKYEAIVNIHKEGPLVAMVEQLGWRVVKLPRIRLTKHHPLKWFGLGERLTWPFWEKIRGERFVRLIEDENIDLVYTNTMVCFEGAYAARKTKRPHVWHLREILPQNQKLFGVFGLNKTLSAILNYSTKIVCVSDAVKHQFPDWQKMPDKFVTIYNGIEPTVFDPENIPPVEKPIQAALNITDEAPLLVYVARISPQKGFHDLLEACILLKQQNVAFHLIVMGESIDQKFFERMKQRITEANLDTQIHFLGKTPAELMPSYLKQMDIFVTPSHDEPFARSILEAMAMQLPVVGTDSGGTPEAVVHQETGLIAKTGNPAALADALKRLILDSTLRKQYGENGRKKVTCDFLIQQTVNNIHTLLEEISVKTV
jgi:glycosyltransferase involved in cell wall biosynthesis